MDLREAILRRRSIRAFTHRPVDVDAVEALKEAVLWAPSAGNLQSRLFCFVTHESTRAALGRASFQPEVFATAPLVVVGCADAAIEAEYGERGRERYAIQDVAAAAQNLLLTAHAHGLGAVWIGAFEPAAVCAALELEEGLEPVVLIPVGTPAQAPAPPEHKPPRSLFRDVV
jgi:nitroreductase